MVLIACLSLLCSPVFSISKTGCNEIAGKTKAVLFNFSRPFAGSGHMVRNKLRWDANNAVGLPKQRNSYPSSPTFLCFDSPTASFSSQYNLFRTMWPDLAKGLFVPFREWTSRFWHHTDPPPGGTLDLNALTVCKEPLKDARISLCWTFSSPELCDSVSRRLGILSGEKNGHSFLLRCSCHYLTQNLEPRLTYRSCFVCLGFLALFSQKWFKFTMLVIPRGSLLNFLELSPAFKLVRTVFTIQCLSKHLLWDTMRNEKVNMETL